jgi:hypothetical protein
MVPIAFGSIRRTKQAHENPHLSSHRAGAQHHQDRGGNRADRGRPRRRRGFQCRGFNSNASQRLELQGAPKFTGLLGPMWDGDAIRYECSATYAELSA